MLIADVGVAIGVEEVVLLVDVVFTVVEVVLTVEVVRVRGLRVKDRV